MGSNKSYYAILGILPSAEPVVIAAAYRALAKRYHPDTWTGDRAVSEQRMREINEAYEVLSNDVKRAKYNQQNKEKFEDYEFDEDVTQSAFENAERAQEADWQLATEYYPDLPQLAAELRQISKNLEFAFQSIIIETKRFPERRKVAKELEDDFLSTYFGQNPEIIKFAKELIAKGHRQAAKELNRAVSVLGKSLDSALVISRIQTKFRSGRGAYSIQQRADKLVQTRNFLDAIDLIEALGGKIKIVGFLGYKREVHVLGETKTCEQRELADWVIHAIVPKVLK